MPRRHFQDPIQIIIHAPFAIAVATAVHQPGLFLVLFSNVCSDPENKTKIAKAIYYSCRVALNLVPQSPWTRSDDICYLSLSLCLSLCLSPLSLS